MMRLDASGGMGPEVGAVVSWRLVIGGDTGWVIAVLITRVTLGVFLRHFGGGVHWTVAATERSGMGSFLQRDILQNRNSVRAWDSNRERTSCRSSEGCS